MSEVMRITLLVKVPEGTLESDREWTGLKYALEDAIATAGASLLRPPFSDWTPDPLIYGVTDKDSLKGVE